MAAQRRLAAHYGPLSSEGISTSRQERGVNTREASSRSLLPISSVMALNSNAARTGTMSYTQQGLLAMGLGICMAPFTGGASLIYGTCHLVCGATYDAANLGGSKSNKQPRRRK